MQPYFPQHVFGCFGGTAVSRTLRSYDSARNAPSSLNGVNQASNGINSLDSGLHSLEPALIAYRVGLVVADLGWLG